MNRRRLVWLCAALTLIGGTIAAWFVYARRDADFVTVGPRTKGVRDNFALLETTIDPADYRDCKTVQDAITRLNSKIKLRPRGLQFTDAWLKGWEVGINCHRRGGDGLMIEAKALAAPFVLAAASEPTTVKQFIREAYAQIGLPDVAFIVNGYGIEVTTANCAQEERARYLDSVSVFDRMHNFWKEMTGTVEPDDPSDVL